MEVRLITVRLRGGLGNQMFQYALGRSLSSELDTELRLDIRGLNTLLGGVTSRSYELKNLNIKNPKKLITQSSGLMAYDMLSPLSRFINLSKMGYFRERSFAYDESIRTIKDGAYLDGHWQTEKYFIDIREKLKEDFHCPIVDRENSEYKNKILASNSVGIHVRRGDYVTNASANLHHGVCGLDYYKKSYDYISEKFSAPRYFIFSDDPEWVRAKFKFIKNKEIICHNKGEDSFWDMQLMKLCKHNIIANSTFSWWGAWLNDSKEKIIIAPRVWFADEKIETNDIIPRSWVRL